MSGRDALPGPKSLPSGSCTMSLACTEGEVQGAPTVCSGETVKASVQGQFPTLSLQK
jgi:hypothetical protein